MRALVVLGNRMKDDGNLSDAAVRRMETALRARDLFRPDYIILSGGLANPVAGITEAAAMKDYLFHQGVNQESMLVEEDSVSTLQNARYTVALAREKGIDELVVITSPEHMARGWLNPIKLFSSEIGEVSDIRLSFYSEGQV